MNDKDLKKYRVLWWITLGVLAALALVVFYFIEPRAAEAAEQGLWVGASPAGYAAWILGGVGLICAIAGARLGRAVFTPGWRVAERLARRIQEQDGGDEISQVINPMLGVYLVAMGLIETTALLGLVLYYRTGAFNAYIVLTGMALLGWLVAKPDAAGETSAAGDKDSPAEDAIPPAGDKDVASGDAVPRAGDEDVASGDAIPRAREEDDESSDDTP